MVCSSRRPAGTVGYSSSFAVNTAFPEAVLKLRLSRGGCGSTNPPGWSILAS
ncbi:MAG: hypothetical protein JWN05_1442 [Arthrobacter sp.]|jgi:hypothetical protein|nr:hypothetical protein [Arthrobacter sp.]